ncbi:hypothetical protein DXG01_013206 [Tephrocybe rancida]|nr:hypothetical protein DXG01_013206 [Tephrocybe rancida]
MPEPRTAATSANPRCTHPRSLAHRSRRASPTAHIATSPPQKRTRRRLTAARTPAHHDAHAGPTEPHVCPPTPVPLTPRSNTSTTRSSTGTPQSNVVRRRLPHSSLTDETPHPQQHTNHAEKRGQPHTTTSAPKPQRDNHAPPPTAHQQPAHRLPYRLPTTYRTAHHLPLPTDRPLHVPATFPASRRRGRHQCNVMTARGPDSRHVPAPVARPCIGGGGGFL